ncbi:MAG TPA: hypothetical protein VEF53_17910 [Patescibacteria group bacterium]|jgi:hypothetical protein|nr:hypothetical protein [Patescibacteria group bacterium]
MSFRRRKKVIGILVFAIGAGILLAVTVPFMGWVIFSAICLICAGIYLLKFN